MFHGSASKEIKICVYTESPTKNFFFIKKNKKGGEQNKGLQNSDALSSIIGFEFHLKVYFWVIKTHLIFNAMTTRHKLIIRASRHISK